MMLEPLHNEDMRKAKELYLSAFPEYERCSYDTLVERMWRDGAEWLGIYDNGFEGMVYILFDDRILYLLYFAIVEGSRNKGMGSKVLIRLREMYPDRKMFLSIEPPDENAEDLEVRRRRMGFYMRNGFIPGHRIADKDGTWMSMCYQDTLEPDEILSFCKDVGLADLFTGDLWIE